MIIPATSRNRLLPLGQCISASGAQRLLPPLSSAPRISCDGTSITTGLSTTNSESYRKKLYELGLAAGINFVFTGKFAAGVPGGAPWTPMNGVVGSTLPDHMTGGAIDIPTWYAGLAPSARPEVWYHELIVNDAAVGGTNVTNYGANLTSYVNSLDAIQPSRHVWELAQQRDDTGYNANIVTINNAVISTVATLAAGGTKIILADSRVLQGVPGLGTIANPGHFEPNVIGWVHPNDAGQLFKSYVVFQGMCLAMGRLQTWAGDGNK